MQVPLLNMLRRHIAFVLAKGSMSLAANLAMHVQARKNARGKPEVKLKTVAAPAAKAKPYQQRPQVM